MTDFSELGSVVRVLSLENEPQFYSVRSHLKPVSGIFGGFSSFFLCKPTEKKNRKRLDLRHRLFTSATARTRFEASVCPTARSLTSPRLRLLHSAVLSALRKNQFTWNPNVSDRTSHNNEEAVRRLTGFQGRGAAGDTTPADVEFLLFAPTAG